MHLLSLVNSNIALYFRLAKRQREYVDKKGIHVVVGHYVGDANKKKINITQGIYVTFTT